MKNLIFLFLTASILFSTGCGKTELIDTDFGAAIEGTYLMTSIVTTNSDIDPQPTANVIIERDSDTQVDMVMDFSTIIVPDLDLPNVTVSQAGDNYNFIKVFSNATADGSVIGTTLNILVTYDDGGTLMVTAEKE